MEQVFSPQVFPSVLAAMAIASVVGGAVKLLIWSESRVEKIASRVADRMVAHAFRSEAFETAVERIAQRISEASKSATYADLKDRADAQSNSIVSAHRRIDDLQREMLSEFKRLRGKRERAADDDVDEA